MRIIGRLAVAMAAVSLGVCLAQQSSTGPRTLELAPAQPLPFRFEMGAYGSQLDRGLGTWRGNEAQLWIRSSSRFIPMVGFDNHTRPEGTQNNYSFFSYMNWNKSFYTVQGFSVAPQRNPRAVFFPRTRFDVKANWKVPPARRLVLGAGYTRFDLGGPVQGQIFNVGAQYYYGKLVVDGNLFINRNQPGDLVSGSGSLTALYGREWNYWVGVTAGGGRELYRYIGLGPVDVRRSSYTINTFYRKWLSRHFGVVFSFDYQNRMDAYRRVGVASKLFFEF